jgi:branched-chain amino acid transport system ATP-binding protein
MLEVSGLFASYGPVRALRGVDLTVAKGEIVCLIGANGAGKTTLLNVISGLLPAKQGGVTLGGEPMTGLKPARVVRRGVVQVPEGRQVFAPLSVRDNLLLGAYLRWKKERAKVEEEMEKVFETFPVLKSRLRQQAGTLSGGEQQMLAIARALMSCPRLLLLDEPSLGLAPLVVREIFRIVAGLPARGCAVLLVEQNARGALSVADRGYVLTGGRVTAGGSSAELMADGQVRAAFLGGAA